MRFRKRKLKNMTEAREVLPKPDIQTEKGGELASALPPVPESDSLGDQHRAIDRAIAKSTKTRLTEQPLTRKKRVAADLDKLPDILTAGPRLEPTPRPGKIFKSPTIGEYINHRQD